MVTWTTAAQVSANTPRLPWLTILAMTTPLGDAPATFAGA